VPLSHEGRRYICPDGFYPCFSCGPQGAAIEILINILAKGQSKKETLDDFIEDCKGIYFIDKARHCAISLGKMHFVEGALGAPRTINTF
jgi:hypothetical protein